MNGLHTQRQIDTIEKKTDRIEKTLKLLIVWLTSELGVESKDALLAELEKERDSE